MQTSIFDSIYIFNSKKSSNIHIYIYIGTLHTYIYSYVKTYIVYKLAI